MDNALNVGVFSQSKDSVLNTLYMDKQSEFLSFPTIYCGKTRVDNYLIIF